MSQRLLVVASAMAVSALAVTLLRRRFSYDDLKDNNEFTALTFAIIGAVYGVYLAFTVVVVWDQFGDAEQNATSEAVYLSQVWRDVQVLPPDARRVLQDDLFAYASAVVDGEWPAMAARRGRDPVASRAYEDLWTHMYTARMQVASSGDAAFFEQAVSQMNQLGMSRRLRLLSANSELPTIMWVLLVGGGVVTITFTLAMGTRRAWMQAGMTAAVAGLIVFSLLIVSAIQHPFVGDVSVRPDAMTDVRESFRDRLQEQRSGKHVEPAR
jgi:hypothetical protein